MTKVPETTLTDALVTYTQSVRHEITDKDLKTNDFKDSLLKTFDAKHPAPPLQLACENESYETQGKVAARAFRRQSSYIEFGRPRR